MCMNALGLTCIQTRSELGDFGSWYILEQVDCVVHGKITPNQKPTLAVKSSALILARGVLVNGLEARLENDCRCEGLDVDGPGWHRLFDVVDRGHFHVPKWRTLYWTSY